LEKLFVAGCEVPGWSVDLRDLESEGIDMSGELMGVHLEQAVLELPYCSDEYCIVKQEAYRAEDFWLDHVHVQSGEAAIACGA
jgi:hypothetical protein